jgi:hypothetical protein
MINETEPIAYYVSLFPELYTLYHLKKIHISTSTYATFLMRYNNTALFIFPYL